MDLAEIAPKAEPPVAKILDWGKYQYEETKQRAKQKKQQRANEVKQVRFGLKIGDHDLEVKLKRVRRFLDEGHKVKVSLMFRGREITHPELGREMLDRIAGLIAEVGSVEQAPQQAGRELTMIVGARKDAKAQNS